MKKLSILTALVALVSFLLVGVPSGAVWADGTETLGPSSIAIASGTGVVVAGTGLSLAQPDTISINVPAGSTVEQVLLYWEGRDFSNGDDTIVINGTTTVIGSLIGVRSYGPPPSVAEALAQAIHTAPTLPISAWSGTGRARI